MRNHFALVLAAVAAVGFMPTIAAGTQAPTGVLSGLVLGTDGLPSAGATVTVTAWPDETVLAKLAEGQAVPTRQLDTATADSAGQYSMSPDVASLPAEYLTANGVDVQITAADDRNQQIWNTTVVPGAAATVSFDMATEHVSSAGNAMFADQPAEAAVEPAQGGVGCGRPQAGSYLYNREER